MTSYFLDLIGPVTVAMRDNVAEIEQRNDEMIVLSGLIMRHGGEQVVCAGMNNEPRGLRKRRKVLKCGRV